MAGNNFLNLQSLNLQSLNRESLNLESLNLESLKLGNVNVNDFATGCGVVCPGTCKMETKAQEPLVEQAKGTKLQMTMRLKQRRGTDEELLYAGPSDLNPPY
jgi:hypothetical protein